MIKLSNLTEEEEMQICEELRESQGIETYLDMSKMCNNLAVVVDFMLRYNNAPMDDVEKNSLETLRELLPICGHLFVQSDDYYRH